jgi:hypothetical protein
LPELHAGRVKYMNQSFFQLALSPMVLFAKQKINAVPTFQTFIELIQSPAKNILFE